MHVSTTNMPIKCYKYALCPYSSMYINLRSMLINMQQNNSLASTTLQAVLYTEDNNANTDNDDNATHLHKLHWPLATPAKNPGLCDNPQATKDRQNCNSIGCDLAKPNKPIIQILSF